MKLKIALLLLTISFLLSFVHPAIASYSFNYTTIDYPSTLCTYVYGLNDSGHVAGVFSTASGLSGFSYNGVSFDIVYYPLTGSDTEAWDINNSGSVSGHYWDSGEAKGFIYNGNSYSTVLPPNTSYAKARGINDSNQVVGYTRNNGFLFDGTTYTSLIVPNSSCSLAYGINNAGKIVGNYCETDSYWHGYIYDSESQTFSTFEAPGATDTFLLGINDLGWMVGGYRTGTVAPLTYFLYDGASFTLISYPGAVETTVYGINNNNQIAGYYRTGPSGSHGFVGTIVPIPTAAWLMGSGLLGLMALKRKRT